MKPKTIVILYAKHLYDSFARTERLFINVLESLESEGRGLLYINGGLAKFEDGTRVEKVSFGTGLIGRRITHLYMDKCALALTNSEQYIREAVMPFIVTENYKHLDVEGSPKDRVMIFDERGTITYLRDYK